MTAGRLGDPAFARLVGDFRGWSPDIGENGWRRFRLCSARDHDPNRFLVSYFRRVSLHIERRPTRRLRVPPTPAGAAERSPRPAHLAECVSTSNAMCSVFRMYL